MSTLSTRAQHSARQLSCGNQGRPTELTPIHSMFYLVQGAPLNFNSPPGESFKVSPFKVLRIVEGSLLKFMISMFSSSSSSSSYEEFTIKMGPLLICIVLLLSSPVATQMRGGRFHIHQTSLSEQQKIWNRKLTEEAEKEQQ